MTNTSSKDALAASPEQVPISPPRVARRRRPVRGTIIYHAVNIGLLVLFLFPLAWAFLSSLKTPVEANQSPPTLFPHQWSLANFVKLSHFGASGLRVYFTNSLVVALLTALGTVVVSTLAGYGFARFRFRFRTTAFVLILAILVIPYPSILIPLYLVLGYLGLQNSLLGLAVVLVMFQLPFSVYMMRNSFAAIPTELDEAALVDGATRIRILRSVLLPLVAPGIVTVGMFAFVAAWNEFLASLLFLQTDDKATLPLALVSAQSGNYGTVDYGVLQAGIVLSMLPCIALFLPLQRFYMNGLLAGGLKS